MYVLKKHVWLDQVSSLYKRTQFETWDKEKILFEHFSGCKSLADDPLSAGVPSFVVQEEFDRYTGYWWQPTTATSKTPPKGNAGF